MKEGDKVKAIKGEFTGKVGEIFAAYPVTEPIVMSNPQGLRAINPMSHFIVKERDGSYFPALESELEIIT
jgi:ribosomal protein L24